MRNPLLRRQPLSNLTYHQAGVLPCANESLFHPWPIHLHDKPLVSLPHVLHHILIWICPCSREILESRSSFDSSTRDNRPRSRLVFLGQVGDIYVARPNQRDSVVHILNGLRGFSVLWQWTLYQITLVHLWWRFDCRRVRAPSAYSPHEDPPISIYLQELLTPRSSPTRQGTRPPPAIRDTPAPFVGATQQDFRRRSSRECRKCDYSSQPRLLKAWTICRCQSNQACDHTSSRSWTGSIRV